MDLLAPATDNDIAVTLSAARPAGANHERTSTDKQAGDDMKINSIMTVRELAEYIRLHERHAPDTEYFGSERRMKEELDSIPMAAADLRLQQQIMESSDADLDMLIGSADRPLPLSQLTNEMLIDLHCEADSRNKALSRLAKLAAWGGVTSSYEDTYLELERRENLQPTVIGQGVAIPHSRFPNSRIFRQPSLIIARSVCGVDFGSGDGQKVHLMFMPCAPTPYMHMRMLAQIAKLIHIPNVIHRFINTTEKRHILLIIKAFEHLKVIS